MQGLLGVEVIHQGVHWVVFVARLVLLLNHVEQRLVLGAQVHLLA